MAERNGGRRVGLEAGLVSLGQSFEDGVHLFSHCSQRKLKLVLEARTNISGVFQVRYWSQ